MSYKLDEINLGAKNLWIPGNRQRESNRVKRLHSVRPRSRHPTFFDEKMRRQSRRFRVFIRKRTPGALECFFLKINFKKVQIFFWITGKLLRRKDTKVIAFIWDEYSVWKNSHYVDFNFIRETVLQLNDIKGLYNMKGGLNIDQPWQNIAAVDSQDFGIARELGEVVRPSETAIPGVCSSRWWSAFDVRGWFRSSGLLVCLHPWFKRKKKSKKITGSGSEWGKVSHTCIQPDLHRGRSKNISNWGTHLAISKKCKNKKRSDSL